MLFSCQASLALQIPNCRSEYTSNCQSVPFANISTLRMIKALDNVYAFIIPLNPLESLSLSIQTDHKALDLPHLESSDAQIEATKPHSSMYPSTPPTRTLVFFEKEAMSQIPQALSIRDISISWWLDHTNQTSAFHFCISVSAASSDLCDMVSQLAAAIVLERESYGNLV